MTRSPAWFIGQRAEGLAVVLLTRFPVTLSREADHTGQRPDLRVLVDPEKPGLREFGVEIKGTMHIRHVVDEHHCVRPQVLRASRRMLEECPFPVALMVFDVATDAGFFGWLLTPVIKGGKAGLLKADPVSVEPATNERIANALSQIREWYAAGPWRMDKAVAHHR
jgi:hypothetical protein